MGISALVYCTLVFSGVGGDGMVLFEFGLMVVVTALIRVAFMIDVGLLYQSVFLLGLVVVIVVMVSLMVVGLINYHHTHHQTNSTIATIT